MLVSLLPTLNKIGSGRTRFRTSSINGTLGLREERVVMVGVDSEQTEEDSLLPVGLVGGTGTLRTEGTTGELWEEEEESRLQQLEREEGLDYRVRRILKLDLRRM